ncbi:hypothetical protein GN958_ATG20404 [Phytophthora infestans]|uniref:Uncharacterized protein n=1 Tax=Phytophthora infestans TaxID=4787 RepID=A0A8S9TNA8_PHYIN|nr:hypothetical protein GN958_ATG20404 [Phytophthora infestans]
MAAPAKTDNIALVLDRDAASAVVVHVVALVVTTVQDLRIAVVQKWCVGCSKQGLVRMRFYWQV